MKKILILARENINLEYTYRDNMDYILGNNHILGFVLDLNNFFKKK